MRILHVSAYYAPAYCYGGPPRSIHGLSTALIESGVEVQVLTTSANGKAELVSQVVDAGEFEGVPVTYLDRAKPKKLFYCPEMKSWLSENINQYDVVHIHGSWNYMSWMAGYICRKNNVPYIISPRGMLESEALKISSMKKRLAYSLIEKRQLKGAAYIHATSEKEKSSIEDLRLDIPVAIIPNGIDLPKSNGLSDGSLRRSLNIPANNFIVLFVGRIHPIKGLDVLCGAIRQLKRSSSGIRLVLIGDGEEAYVSKLKSDFSDLIGSGNLYFTGHLEGKEKAEAYLTADVFALMSHSENFGLAAAEAMSYGLPVILSKGCPWPQIEEWKAGYWVESSEQLVAESIQRLDEDRNMAQAMGNNAKENISSYLDWQLIANKMKMAYTKILSEKP